MHLLHQLALYRSDPRLETRNDHVLLHKPRSKCCAAALHPRSKGAPARFPSDACGCQSRRQERAEQRAAPGHFGTFRILGTS